MDSEIKKRKRKIAALIEDLVTIKIEDAENMVMIGILADAPFLPSAKFTQEVEAEKKSLWDNAIYYEDRYGNKGVSLDGGLTLFNHLGERVTIPEGTPYVEH